MMSAAETHGEEAGLGLAQLVEGVLDEPMVDALFRDLEQCTKVLEVSVKFAARGYVAEGAIGLGAARRMLAGQEVRGVQIRYRYDGREWCDTLMRLPGGVRIVRVRYDLTQCAEA